MTRIQHTVSSGLVLPSLTEERNNYLNSIWNFPSPPTLSSLFLLVSLRVCSQEAMLQSEWDVRSSHFSPEMSHFLHHACIFVCFVFLITCSQSVRSAHNAPQISTSLNLNSPLRFRRHGKQTFWKGWKGKKLSKIFETHKACLFTIIDYKRKNTWLNAIMIEASFYMESSNLSH